MNVVVQIKLVLFFREPNIQSKQALITEHTATFPLHIINQIAAKYIQRATTKPQNNH